MVGSPSPCWTLSRACSGIACVVHAWVTQPMAVEYLLWMRQRYPDNQLIGGQNPLILFGLKNHPKLVVQDFACPSTEFKKLKRWWGVSPRPESHPKLQPGSPAITSGALPRRLTTRRHHNHQQTVHYKLNTLFIYLPIDRWMMYIIYSSIYTYIYNYYIKCSIFLYIM